MIIRHREHKSAVHYTRNFSRNDAPGRGFSFPCDEHGNVETGSFGDNLRKCLDGTFDVTDHGAVPNEHHWVECAILRCSCGQEVELDGFTNTCDCGQDYNMGGQRLAPRSQWGEETGESLSDILNIR